MFFSSDHHALEIVGVFRATRRASRSESAARAHSSLGIRLCGEGVFSFGKTTLTAGEGQLLYIPSGISYTQRTAGEEFLSVCFLEGGEPARLPELITLHHAEEIRRALLSLFEIWHRKERGYRTECHALLYRVLYLALRETDTPPDEDARTAAILASATAYIRDHLEDGRLSVRELSRRACLSETYFRRIFRAAYGLSPCAYIRTLRVEVAASLLEGGELTVCEAAERVGFRDPKYFSREFRRLKGAAPSEYLKRGR